MWCQFIKISEMLKKIYYSLILIGSSTKIPESLQWLNFYNVKSDFELTFEYKIQLFAKVILVLSPIAFLLEQFNLWFTNNNVFFSVVLWAILANMIFGGWLHWKNGTFKLKILLIKNIEMCLIILMAYPILEGISYVAGENITGQVFKIVIQIATILFPAGKALKNAHILSNYQYPSHFIMERIYNFEKDGNIDKFLGKNNNQEIENINENQEE